MSNKIKYYPERESEPIEFNETHVRIVLPNGSHFRLNFDPREEALYIQKEIGENNDSRITVHPGVSNVILVK